MGHDTVLQYFFVLQLHLFGRFQQGQTDASFSCTPYTGTDENLFVVYFRNCSCNSMPQQPKELVYFCSRTHGTKVEVIDEKYLNATSDAAEGPMLQGVGALITQGTWVAAFAFPRCICIPSCCIIASNQAKSCRPWRLAGTANYIAGHTLDICRHAPTEPMEMDVIACIGPGTSQTFIYEVLKSQV